MKSRYHIKISGDVQGVFFRSETKRRAQSLNLTGWVKNTPDGTVEIIAEGEKDNLRKLAVWCGEGPSAARVSNVKLKEREYKREFKTFSVKY